MSVMTPGAAGQDGENLAMAYAALGLDSLPSQVRGGFRGTEIRIRTSFGYTVPHTLVVLRREPGSEWEGATWLWSTGGESYSPMPPMIVDSCEGADFLEAILCRADTSTPIDWTYVGALVVDSLGVLELPDPSALPFPTVGVIDGLYLFAEMAEAGQYRSIAWINHEVRQEPETIQAHELHRLADALTQPTCWNDFPSPWPERMIRIYGEVPSRPCSQ